MVEHPKTPLVLPEDLNRQIEDLAKKLKISESHLVRIALARFLSDYLENHTLDEIHTAAFNEPYHDDQPTDAYRIVNQGDIYWVKLDTLVSSVTEVVHPYVVIQDNLFNHGRVTTVIACALTSNLKRANWLGNVLLEVGEANLPKQSVVEVSKASTLEKRQLGKYIGSLTTHRIHQVLAGIQFLQRSYFA